MKRGTQAVCQLCRNMEKKQPARRVVDLLGANSQKTMVDVLSVLQTVKDIMTEQPARAACGVQAFR